MSLQSYWRTHKLTVEEFSPYEVLWKCGECGLVTQEEVQTLPTYSYTNMFCDSCLQNTKHVWEDITQ